MVYEYGKHHKVGPQITKFGETLMPRAKCLLGQPQTCQAKGTHPSPTESRKLVEVSFT